MSTVILLRHGRTQANATGLLAGRSSGVALDEVGQRQVADAAARLTGVTISALWTSPMQRCKQTAKAVAAGRASLRIRVERGLNECDYGEWQGRPLRELAKEPLWKVVQTQPSVAEFPGGESLPSMQQRAVNAVRRLDRQVEQEHGDGAVWVAVTHGDIVKSVLADALGMHLDLFQRLHVDPASISVVRYTPTRPYVLATNTHAGDLSWLSGARGSRKRGAARRTRAAHDAPVGGGGGPAGPRS